MENKILDLFLFNHKLKFSEIEKSLNVRSNKLNYHLQNLVKKGILSKEGSNYSLTEASEYLIPYLSEKKSALPVILIHIGNNKKALLYKRNKRPYKDMLSLPGGRLVLGESIKEGVKRIMKEKYNLNARLSKIHSISLEHVNKSGKTIHSFLLIFVSANSKEVKLIDIDKNKKNTIKSDFYLIKNHLNKEIKIKEILSKTF
jgi:ADP-ribose pyrophosphatase YjhB (NUDIX family)